MSDQPSTTDTTASAASATDRHPDGSQHGSRTQRLVIRPGRHVGWWVDGRSVGGRRFMWTWWPTKGLAAVAARTWAGVARRWGGREVTIDELAGA